MSTAKQPGLSERRPNTALRWRSYTRAEIIDLRCDCGGQIYLDDCFATEGSRQWRYEAFCWQCKSCDPNGYPSIKQAITGSWVYFQPTEQK